MPRDAAQLRDDALRIWTAGVEAVKPGPLVFEHVHVAGGDLWLGDKCVQLEQIDRIVVVGAGKAAAGMALAVEQTLGPLLLHEKVVTGLVNVPADCLLPIDRIHLRAGRPAGVNEPTEAGAAATRDMLQMVAALGPRDLCLALISGGGSALLPAPIAGLQLADKVALTRTMSARGATIEQMNVVRRELSAIKGGGLARNCRAGRLVALILSDVPGDDLSLVASGPTLLRQPTPAEALRVARELELSDLPEGRTAIALLERLATDAKATATPARRITNLLVGNNAAAVDAAGVAAEQLGYSHVMISATAPEGLAEDVAAQLAAMAIQMRGNASLPDCLISGGEPTVHLAPEATRGRGGRNQQLALAALAAIDDWRGLCLLAGGTDGEDGPTDAAGACVDERVAAEVRRLQLDPLDFLARNDAYHFFERTGGLLKSGPTHTNVCDLRVVTASR